jgi:integrase
LYAKAKIDAVEGKLATKAEKPIDPLFREVAADFVEDYQATRRLNSAKSARSHVSLYLKAFGAKRMSDITVKDIQEWQTAQVKQGKKPATVNRYLVVLSELFAWAVQQGRTASNPAAEIGLLKVRNARTRFLSDEEEVILLEACGANLRAVVIAALHTGFRREELARLTWRDVDLQREVFRVTADLAKSGHMREVPMDQTLMTLLKRLKPDIIDLKEPVFKNRFGVGFRRLSTLFAQVVRKTTLHDLRLHDLRHTG